MLRGSIKDVQKSLARGDISVTQLCNDAFKQIHDTRNLNAFITTRQNDAFKEASVLDEQLRLEGNDNEHNRSPLFGVPISIKDNFCTKQLLTTCGSKMLHNFVPPYDATVVTKLRLAQCIVMGKTNMDEFAMGSSCTTSFYGPAANYHNRHLLDGKTPNECQDSKSWFMAGGSSTGSAVSVAAGACFASIGTDTGGSTRQPASLTGVVGFKPTYGLISRFGLIPLAHCLDVVSLLARSVDDTSLVFQQVIGQDDNDLTSVDHNLCLKSTRLSESGLSGQAIRVGIPDEFANKGDLSTDVASHYSEMIKRLSSRAKDTDGLNFEIVNISLPNANLATECYTIISSAEIASNMSCFDGVKYGLSIPYGQSSDKPFNRDDFFKANRDAGFGLEVKKRILLGNYFMLSGNREKYLHQALKMRRLIGNDFEKAFRNDKVDVILLPSTPTTSISYHEWLSKQDDNKLFREDYFLIPANLANLPAISLPGGISSNGMPIGFQLIADRFHDRDLLTISKYFEENIFSESSKQ